MMGAGAAATLLHLSARDNVAVATAALEPGQSVSLIDGEGIAVIDTVPAGHKIAVADIAQGQPVIKFGVDIGTATHAIARGQHVHVHNLESERMRGDRG